ncbi:metallopeptidase MepB [Akanthomyces lecanii RCEF 1005]|uniref:Metallopeptidase MepB n=1 Tax=Akanthomyces lecanii RCEF 1005 TaxID=1081108 RepID=A0A167V9T4_CORDF|nr:metallopeptidase MepB [Akanthomyces lecanii RCEF 1005]
MALLRQELPRAPTEDEIPTIAQRHAAAYTQLLEHILAGVGLDNATLENTVLAIAHLENSQATERALLMALKYCSPFWSVQTKCEEAEALWQELGNGQRERIYSLIASARATSPQQHTQVIRLADKMLSDLQDLGIGSMHGPSAKKIQANKDSIQQHSLMFLRNLREVDRSSEADINELDDILNQLRNTELIEADGQPAKLRVPYTGNYHTVMQRAHSADIRKKMFEIHSSRYNRNTSLFKEILLLRDENARLLGFENHAELRLPDRLPPSIAAVNKLLGSTLDALQQHKQAETGSRLAASESLKNEDETIITQPWDKAYNRAKLAQESRVAGATKFAEYFPLWHTVQMMIVLAQDLFELKFESITAESLLEANWPKEVKGWRVWEREPSSNSFIGYFLADSQDRPHKYKGNQSVNLGPGLLSIRYGCAYTSHSPGLARHERGRGMAGCVLRAMTTPPTIANSYVGFGHLVSDYDAGYYTYIYADVVAANLARTLFATDPREKQMWNKFRREILEKGGSEDEYTLLKDFLGYPPDDTSAFFAALGLQLNQPKIQPRNDNPPDAESQTQLENRTKYRITTC